MSSASRGLHLNRVLPLVRSYYEDIATRGGRLLDAGCGSGEKTELFRSHGMEAHGIDHSASAITSARKRYNACSFRVGNVEHLPYERDTFDALFSCSVLQYVNTDQTLVEYARVVKPGGRLVFVENLRHNPVALAARLAYRVGLWEYPETMTPKQHVSFNLPSRLASDFKITDASVFNLTTPIALGLPAFLDRIGLRRQKKDDVKRLRQPLRRIDDYLLRRIPLLRRLCWTIFIRAIRK